MTSNVPEHLRSVLADYDVLGSHGNSRYGDPWQPRVNVLLDRVQVISDNDELILKGRWLNQEGGSKATFMQSVFPQHADSEVGDKELFLKLSWEKDERPDTIPSKMYLLRIRDAFHEWRQDDVDFVVDNDSCCVSLVPQPSSCTHVLEAFAGGYGGWSAAAEFLHAHGPCEYMTIGIDSCMGAAMMYAMTHECPIIDAHQTLPWDAIVRLNQGAVLHGDFDSSCWLSAISTWGVDVMAISAPCPAWSGAAGQSGIDSTQGLLLPQAILTARFLRPLVLTIEQVNGFGTHAHKKHVLNCIKHIGYKLVFQRTLDAAEFGAAHRIRWLGIAIRVHAPTIELSPFQGWPQIPQCTPENLHVLFPAGWVDEDPLILTHEMKQLGMDPKLVPFFLQDQLRGASPQQIWLARGTTPQEVVPTFMSLYGSQHSISPSSLHGKGFMLHFLRRYAGEHVEERLFHPSEILMMHLACDRFFIPSSCKEAWRHVGNIICLPHALVIMAHVHNGLHPNQTVTTSVLFNLLLSDHLGIPHLHIVSSEVGTLYVHCDTNHTPSDQLQMQLSNLQILWNKVGLSRMEPGELWTPLKGIQVLEIFLDQQLYASQCTIPNATQLVEGTEPSSIATCPFNIMVKIRVITPQGCGFFWISTTQPCEYFQNLFSMRFHLTETADDPDGCSFTLQMVTEGPMFALENCDWNVMVVIDDGSMTLMPAAQTDHADVIPMLKEHFGTADWYDVLGLIPANGRRISQLLMDVPIEHSSIQVPTCMVLAASQQTTVTAVWDSTQAALIFRITGDPTAVTTMVDFWHTVFTDDSMCLLMQEIHVQTEPGRAEIHCHHVNEGFLIPFHLLRGHFTTAALRRLLDSMHENTGEPVVLKRFGRPLWQGNLNQELSCLTLLNIMDLAFYPFFGGEVTRLISCGKVVYDVKIGELMRPSNFQKHTLHVEFRSVGGTGAKNQQRQYVKNTIAACFLERGYPFEWTATTVDQLLERIGMKTLTQLVAMPAGQARMDQLLQHAKDCSIQVPDRVTREAGKTIAKGNQVTKDRKRQAVQVDPSQYRIELSFLCNEDGSTPNQLSTISTSQAGVALMRFEDAQPWIQESRIISADELAIAILGHHSLSGSLKSLCCSLPCVDAAGRPVILAVTLLQLGAKAIVPVANDKKVAEQSCTTVALTLWQDEWSEAEWRKALDGTYPFIKSLLSKHGHEDLVESMWGRSLRTDSLHDAHGKPVQSLQIHAAIKQDKVTELLRTSGFNSLYATPKSKEGRISGDWRVIWVTGGMARLNALAAETQHCAGLVRSKRSFGLRYLAEHFPTAWKVINGDQELPSDLEIKHVYRVEPLPFGTTAEMLRSWSTLLSWPLRPIKALGARAWLVGSSVPPPDGLHLFNTNPVIIRMIPPKGSTDSHPILAGPRPLKGSTTKPSPQEDPWGPYFDPWNRSSAGTGTGSQATPASQARSLQGPVEAKFAAHDERMTKMEQSLAALQSSNEQLRQDTAKGFAAVE
eukprot:Skav223780  [mRNA]  locus=scaffold575:7395:11870:+ [translate_table: standard]